MSSHNALVYHEAEIEIEFDHAPGCPATGPSYACGGTPAEPDEVSIESFTLTLSNATTLTINADDLTAAGYAKIRRWLESEYHDDMVAEVPTGPDPDEAYERSRDDRMEAW